MIAQASSTVCAAAAGTLAAGSGVADAPSVGAGVAVPAAPAVLLGVGVAERVEVGDDDGWADPEHPVSMSAPDTTTTAMTLR
ncbi:hypothetical protein [Leifsonia sp. Leaf264]|uniref:hypothetical protein n=1 Tax=Leifsonia sp. Leaf264 TaxID=1736314 RepID=UPI0006FD0C10|nr:hypothetical protein [Leifsonia sp. Leaf264]KQO96844.1 hypothetical protein ASF30_17340 [Leifsonia sp. Leaf264]